MSIKGLTNGAARWPRIGVLRKGGPKPNDKQPGPDLGENFRFTGNDAGVEADWAEVFGTDDQGRLLVDGLSIRLPYPTVDANWAAWRELWVAGGLVCRCDGEQHVLWRDKEGKVVLDNPQPCPGRSCQAKPVGRLEVLVSDLRRMGTVTVQTTSKNDIINLDGCLRALALAFGDVSRLPLRLSRVSRMISTPAGDGKRARREKWLLHLEADPQWVRYMLDAQGHAPAHLLQSVEVLSLPAPDNDDPNAADIDVETGEVIDAITAGARDLDVADPGGNDDIEPAAAPAHDPDHWTPEIAACKTCDEVLALLPRLAEIEPLPRREHTVRIAYARIVHLASAALDNLDWTKPAAVERRLAAAAIKLDPLPPNTPGWNLAMDKLIAARDRLAEGAGVTMSKAAA